VTGEVADATGDGVEAVEGARSGVPLPPEREQAAARATRRTRRDERRFMRIPDRQPACPEGAAWLVDLAPDLLLASRKDVLRRTS
jgi:hypothetical protein